MTVFAHERFGGGWDVERRMGADPLFWEWAVCGVSYEEVVLFLASLGLRLDPSGRCREAGGWMWVPRRLR